MVDEVSELTQRGSSTLQRARAQRLLEQIEEFEDLRSRFVSLEKSDSLPVGTGTSFDPVTGRSVHGPLAGQTLDLLPGFTAFPWEFVQLWPDGRTWDPVR